MKILLLFLSFASVGWAKGIPGDVGIKIFNGTDAFPGQFPYMAAIRWRSHYFGGGVLLTPNWVLTHSDIVSYPNTQVILGLHDFDDFDNGGQGAVYDIEHIVMEPSGNSYLALLKLSTPVMPGNPYIQTIALPPQDGDDYVGANCYYCGWGHTESGFEGGVLKYSQANVVGEDDCLGDSYPHLFEICVVDQYTGTCYGDHGSPLVCRKDGLTYLVGTFRYDDLCRSPYRTFFHRISYYSDWIRAVIGSY